MIDSQDVFIYPSNLYSDAEQQKLQETREKVNTHIIRCLN